MNIDIAAETARVMSFKELATWGNRFSLERYNEAAFLAFLDVMDVQRVVLEERTWNPSAFLEKLVTCPEGGDIVIKSIHTLPLDCCSLLRDLMFGSPDSDMLKNRYIFIGVSDRHSLEQVQGEVLALCTPIDLPLFVQHETMTTGLMSLNVMLTNIPVV